ncbi:MAG: hypothetical protein KA201_01660 [Kofleriaceae bacterium]|nr:hypothetical protein [Kofleriaceae bacterium]
MCAFECELHGLGGGVFMCPCLRDALLAERRLDVAGRVDRLGDEFLFCSDCALEVGDVLAAEEGTPEGEVADTWYAERIIFECFRCVAERLAAVGLPSYRQILDNERERLLVSGKALRARMPAYECGRHECQWGIPMCRSVYDALLAGRTPDVVAQLNRYSDAYLRCPDCAAKASVVVAAKAGTVDGDALNFRFEGPTQVDCIVCLDERLKRVPLPSVSELLDEARARRDASR